MSKSCREVWRDNLPLVKKIFDIIVPEIDTNQENYGNNLKKLFVKLTDDELSTALSLVGSASELSSILEFGLKATIILRQIDKKKELV